MNILLAGDVHWSSYSSIIRRRGDKYSKRLENLINTVNWIEETAEQRNCELIIYCGDFFDRPELNAEELTALQEIIWAPNCKHVMLIGNHEGLTHDLSLSSTHLFNLIPNVQVVDKPTLETYFGFRIMYLPYILEKDRLTIREYINNGLRENPWETQELKYNIVGSHNDIKMQYGMFESKEGFELNDINTNSQWFFNGHLHNCGKFGDRAYNLGNVTGQNFSEDAFNYKHQIYLFNTDGQELEFIENPYAFNFYKLEVKNIEKLINILGAIKNNAIVTIKCPESISNDIKQLLESCDNVKEHKVLSIIENKAKDLENDISIEDLQTVNHLEAFITYVKDNLEINDLILSELSEVCK